MVVLKPVPAIAPGLIVQFPDGKPLNTTLPVATEQVGWVIAPTIGVEGVAAIITTLADATEVHPTEFVTIKPYVPGAIPDTVIPAPVSRASCRESRARPCPGNPPPAACPRPPHRAAARWGNRRR